MTNTRALASLALALVALAPGRLLATCLESEPALIWSLPARNETGVPANAKFWFLTPAFSGELVVDVDGQRAQSTDVRGMFEPGSLEPFAGVSPNVLRCEGDACSQTGAPTTFAALAALLLVIRRRPGQRETIRD